MRSTLVVLAALITLTIQTPAGPSPVPVCTYTCPPTDLAGRPLQEHSQSSSQLFCRYLSIPNDFFCKYQIDDGSLKQDHDDGFCPHGATYTCGLRKRNALPRSPAPPSPAARSPKPQIMHTRNNLGKKKRGE